MITSPINRLVRNHGRAWSSIDLDVLARMIANKDSYDKMSAILGRSEGSIKSMIDGRSGKLTHDMLKVKLTKIITGWLKPADVLKSTGTFTTPRGSALGSIIGVRDLSVPKIDETFIPFINPFATSTVAAPTAPIKKPANHNARWNDADDALLTRLYKGNTGLVQMASQLRRTTSGVLGRLAKLGFLFFDKEENAFMVAPTVYYKF